VAPLQFAGWQKAKYVFGKAFETAGAVLWRVGDGGNDLPKAKKFFTKGFW
jgi:hypothetical protein